jgi:hypothetical protein
MYGEVPIEDHPSEMFQLRPPPAKHEVQERVSLPEALRRDVHALEAEVLVAPSKHFAGRLGVYPSRSFKQGELVFHARCAVGWQSQEEVYANSFAADFVLRVSLLKSNRQPEVKFLMGVVAADVFANINPCASAGGV